MTRGGNPGELRSLGIETASPGRFGEVERQRVGGYYVAYPLAWQEHAACKGEDTRALYRVMSRADLDRMGAMCAGCPVLDQCREHAMANEPYGYWAGMTAKERQRQGGTRYATRPPWSPGSKSAA